MTPPFTANLVKLPPAKRTISPKKKKFDILFEIQTYARGFYQDLAKSQRR